MANAKSGDTVSVHYTGKLDDGTVFDSSLEREPLSFTLGQGMVIQGFEDAVDGMEAGEKKTVTLEPGDAYGERHDELMLSIPRTELPDTITPEEGMVLQFMGQDGSQNMATIVGLDEETISLDANHPLAGKQLIFELELVEIS